MNVQTSNTSKLPICHAYLGQVHEMESFFGNNFTLECYEILTLTKIPKKDRLEEPELMQSKWFDYRLMHPMMATYYFYSIYQRCYKEFWKKNVNVESYHFVKANKKSDDFLDFKERLSVWRLRQKADKLGIKYDFFIRELLNLSKAMYFNGRIVVPRPSMLNNDELILSVYALWHEYKCNRLLFSELSFFKSENYCRSKIQDEHERFVIDYIRNRPEFVQKQIVRSCLLELRVLRVETILLNFTTTVVRALC